MFKFLADIFGYSSPELKTRVIPGTTDYLCHSEALSVTRSVFMNVSEMKMPDALKEFHETYPDVRVTSHTVTHLGRDEKNEGEMFFIIIFFE